MEKSGLTLVREARAGMEKKGLQKLYVPYVGPKVIYSASFGNQPLIGPEVAGVPSGFLLSLEHYAPSLGRS